MKNTKTKNLIKNLSRRLITAIVLMCLLIPYFSDILPGGSAQAARKLTLINAQKLAIANSDKIESLDLQIEAKTAARESAVRSITEKYKNMQTFRWSPLLNFKFPTKPNEAEDFEFQYKPVQLEYEIQTIKHKKEDAKLEINQKISSIYIDIITSTMEISFLEERIDNLELTIRKNRARLVEGTATQAQIDQQNARLDGLKNSLSSEKTKLQRSKEKLGKQIGFTVTQGYTFEEAYVSTRMTRDAADYLKAHAMGSTAEDDKNNILDQTVYEARQAKDLALLQMNLNYYLMAQHYGAGYMNMIKSYYDQAMGGSKINKRSFKKAYDSFLKAIDEPWTGKKRILFFKLPKVWWKGEIDGIRYVEDDPYVLYSSILEYESALKDYNNARDELARNIEDTLDNMMETRKAYKQAMSELEFLKNQLVYDEALNALGQLTMEEYEAELTEYENARSGLKDALATYSKSLYELDRTSCGGASSYFVEEAISTQVGHAGLGTVEESAGDRIEEELSGLSVAVEKGAIYSIRSIVESQEFMLYIDVPDDFEYNITHFELWSDGRQIGERVAKNESIRHLTLTVQDVSSVCIRLYDGETFIDSCAINPEVTTGPLEIKKEYLSAQTDLSKVIGSYTVEDDTNTDMIRLRFTFDTKAVENNFALGSEVAFYNLCAEQNLYLFSNDLIGYEEPFTYMSFIKNDLGKLTIRLFAQDGSYIGGADLDPSANKLVANTDVTEADMQEMAARDLVIQQKTAELQAEKQRISDLLAAATEVNGQEADSATMTYYKARLEEIDLQIADVSSTITNEEVQQALVDNAEEIDRMVNAMNRDENGGTVTESTLSQEEMAARNAILEKAAEDFVKDLRKKETADSIKNTINAKEQDKLVLVVELEKAEKEGNETQAASLREQIAAIQKEIDVNNNKLTLLEGDESSVKPEDIQNALMLYGDEIYAMASDQLSDSMLYGSETGQMAIAYLESKGLPVNEENIRMVVSQADNFKTYDAMLARQGAMQDELAEAKSKIEELRSSGMRADGTLEPKSESLIKELEKAAAAYEKELKILDKEIKKYDPAKEIITKEARAEKENLSNQLASNKEARDSLLASSYPSKEAYTREVKNKLDADNAKLESLDLQMESIKKQYEEDIALLEEMNKTVSENEASDQKYNEKKKALEDELAAAQKEYEMYKDKCDAVWGLGKLFYKNSRDAALAKVTELQNKLAALNTEHEQAKKDIDARNKMIADKKAELDERLKAYQDVVKKIQDERDDEQDKLAKMEENWDKSAAIKQEYDEKIRSQEQRLGQLNDIIREYY